MSTCDTAQHALTRQCVSSRMTARNPEHPQFAAEVARALRTTKAAKSEAQGAAHDHASACVTRAMAKRDRHDAMTDPGALHVVGGSKSNAKISKFFLLYAELRKSPTGRFGPEVPGNSAERRHVGGFAMSRRPRASQPRPTIPPRSRRPARTRRPAARPAKSLLSVKTLAPRKRLKPGKSAI